MSPNLAQCVVLLCIRLIQATLFASDLLWSSVHISSPCPRLFLSATTRFLEKGEKSISCVEWFYKKAVWDVVKSWEFEENLRCIKILRIRRKTPMKWIVSISRDYWVYLTLLWKVLRSENSEDNSDAGRRTKFVPVKSLDSSEFSAEFSNLRTFSE